MGGGDNGIGRVAMVSDNKTVAIHKQYSMGVRANVRVCTNTKVSGYTGLSGGGTWD